MKCFLFIFTFFYLCLSFAQSHEFSVRFEEATKSLYYREGKSLEGKVKVQFSPATLKEKLSFTASEGGKIIATQFLPPNQYWITFTATKAQSFQVKANWVLPFQVGEIPSQPLHLPLASCSVSVTPRLKAEKRQALVVLVNGDFPFMDALGHVCVEQTIGFAYDQKDYFYQRNNTAIHFLDTIKKRQAEGYVVDVLTLTHGHEELISSRPNITNQMIRETLANSPSLRLVYMIGCVNASLVDDWLAVGAKSALGHINNNYLPHLFFPYLFKMLGDGVPLHSAGLRAYTCAKETALKIAKFASYDDPDSIQREVYDSTPYFAGQNINIYGKVFAEETNLAMVLDERFNQIERKIYTHTPLETKIFDTLKQIVPYSNRKALNYVEGINPMLRELLPAAWEMANQVFCEQNARGEITLTFEEIAPLLLSFPPLARLPREQLKSFVPAVTFRPQGEDRLQIQFDIAQGKGQTIRLKSYEQSRQGELYEIRLAPKILLDVELIEKDRFSLKIQGLFLLFNLPSIIPNDVSLKEIEFDYSKSLFTVLARSTYTFVSLKLQLDLLKGSLEELEVGGISLKEKIFQSMKK